MYKVQFINAYTQEILREEFYDKVDFILSMIEDFKRVKEQGLDCFILDNQRRTLQSEFVSHSILNLAHSKVYRIFFKTKLASIQAVIRD